MVKITNRFMINSEQFVKTHYGASGWRNLLPTLEKQTQNYYDKKIDPKEYVDFTMVSDVLKAVERQFAEKSPSVLFDLGLHNSEKDLSATQKLVMRFISVEWVLKLAAILWKQRVVNGGTISIERRGEGNVLAKVKDFETPTSQWWKYLAGWFCCAIRFSGGKNVKVEWIRGGDGKTPAEFDAKWE